MNTPTARYLYLCEEAMDEPPWDNVLDLPLPPKPSIELLARASTMVLRYMAIVFGDVAFFHADAIEPEIQRAADRLTELAIARFEAIKRVEKERP